MECFIPKTFSLLGNVVVSSWNSLCHVPKIYPTSSLYSIHSSLSLKYPFLFPLSRFRSRMGSPMSFFDPPGHFGSHSDVQLKSSLHFFTFPSLNWQGHIVTPLLCFLVSPFGLWTTGGQETLLIYLCSPQSLEYIDSQKILIFWNNVLWMILVELFMICTCQLLSIFSP